MEPPRLVAVGVRLAAVGPALSARARWARPCARARRRIGGGRIGGAVSRDGGRVATRLAARGRTEACRPQFPWRDSQRSVVLVNRSSVTAPLVRRATPPTRERGAEGIDGATRRCFFSRRHRELLTRVATLPPSYSDGGCLRRGTADGMCPCSAGLSGMRLEDPAEVSKCIPPFFGPAIAAPDGRFQTTPLHGPCIVHTPRAPPRGRAARGSHGPSTGGRSTAQSLTPDLSRRPPRETRTARPGGPRSRRLHGLRPVTRRSVNRRAAVRRVGLGVGLL